MEIDGVKILHYITVKNNDTILCLIKQVASMENFSHQGREPFPLKLRAPTMEDSETSFLVVFG